LLFLFDQFIAPLVVHFPQEEPAITATRIKDVLVLVVPQQVNAVVV